LSLVNFRLFVAAIVLACGWSAAPRAIQAALDTRALQEAVAIGQSRLTGERERFHAPYALMVAKAPVDYVDVITPFRRIVLAAQAQAEIGNRSYGQRDALETLAAAPDILEFDIELTFHPLNTYIGVPDYRVALVPPGGTTPRIEPESLDRIPRFGPRVSGMPLPHARPGGLIPAQGRDRGGQPMLGGTVVAQYDLMALDANGRYDLMISEAGTELARVRIDLERLR
jgi:hypothetical protein